MFTTCNFWRRQKKNFFKAVFVFTLGAACCSSAWALPQDPAATKGYGGATGKSAHYSESGQPQHQAVNESASLGRQIRHLVTETERVRGLHFKESVKCHFCTQNEASNYLLEANRQEAKPHIDGRRNLFFHHLGLLEQGQNFKNYADLLYSEQVRGLYDTVNKILLVVTDILEEPKLDAIISKLLNHFNIDLSDLLLVHELCHALQDQNFDLGGKLASTEGCLDKELALTAVAEGDATRTMFSYLASSMGLNGDTISKYIVSSPQLVEKGLNQFPQLEKAPLIVRAVTLMPYFNGLDFCQVLEEQQGIAGINGAFANPPASTEHILHPFKHIKKVDPPKNIDLSALPSSFGDYVSLGDDTAGEYVVRTWIEKFSRAKAAAAARGWGGDTWRVYSQDYQSYSLNELGQFKSNKFNSVHNSAGGAEGANGQVSSAAEPESGNKAIGESKSGLDGSTGSFVVWASIWDSEGDAKEFAEAVKNILGSKAEIHAQDRSVIVLLNVPESQIKSVREVIAKPSIMVRN
ncbi:MAG: hypothetical protein ACI38Q_09840 [Candidatus Bruticola sp.]